MVADLSDAKLIERVKEYVWNRGIGYAVMVVTAWVLVGTIFYAKYDEFGWVGGFTYAVSIAFTIGYQTELVEAGSWSYLFSTIYIFGGILMMSGLLLYISHLERIESIAWYKRRAKRIDRMKSIPNVGANTTQGIWIKWKIFFADNQSAVLSWIALVIYFIFGVIVTTIHDNITVIEAIYYIMSTLSTCGVYNPYIHSLDNFFIFSSIYAVFGIILGSVAIVYLLNVMSVALLYDRLNRHIEYSVNTDEFEALKQLKITEEGGNISRQEYLIATAIRMELINEDFVAYVFEKYDSDPKHARVFDTDIYLGGASSESSKLLP